MGSSSEPKNDLKMCRKLMGELMRHRSCGPFLKPVDPNLYPDYYQVVKDPLDLGTIKVPTSTFATPHTDHPVNHASQPAGC